MLATNGASIGAVMVMLVAAEAWLLLIALRPFLAAIRYPTSQLLSDLVSTERLRDIGAILAHIRQSKTQR